MDQHARLRPHSVIPGFGLTLGYTVSYLSLIVLIPALGAGRSQGAVQPWAQFQATPFSIRARCRLAADFRNRFRRIADQRVLRIDRGLGRWCATIFPAAAFSTR